MTNIKHHETSSVLVWKKICHLHKRLLLMRALRIFHFPYFFGQKISQNICLHLQVYFDRVIGTPVFYVFPPIFLELVSNWFCQYFGSFPLLLKFHGLWKLKNVSIIWIYYLNFASKSYEWVIVSYPFVLFIQWGIERLTFIHKSVYWKIGWIRDVVISPVRWGKTKGSSWLFQFFSLFPPLFFPSNINNGVLWMIIENVYSYT